MSDQMFLRAGSKNQTTAKYLKLLALLGVGCLAYLACASFGNGTVAQHKSNGAMTLASFYPTLANRGEVNLFENGNFGGRKLTFTAGFKGNLDSYGFNDAMSSLQIGDGLRVKFCSNNNCAGNSWSDSFELLGPYNAPSQQSANDWVSYLEVYSYDPVTEPRVLLLGAGNFDFDRSGTFTAGRYSTEDIKSNHLDKPGYGGSASGIVVPSQLKVVLYRGDWFQGEYTELAGPLQADFTAGGAYAKWNDQIGSMIIARRDAPIQVTGGWKNVASNNDYISTQITVGVTIDQTKTNENEISASMTVGMEFGSEAVGYKASVSVTAGMAIRNSVSDTLSRTSSTQITATCTNPNRVKTTLWQWHMTGTRDGAVIMDLTDNTFICKLGDQPPMCPLGFCADDECNTCRPYT